ncbi:hypothetical protein GCM10023116_13030 [Kistimonas scapharcae]|uniref:Tail assembly chaperone n=1 Tax=Kistimonas scapharcae TaxID=1036133 RepID=A0ABP8UZ45_9GAMM
MGINARHFRQYVVRPTLQEMGMWSEAAENLMMGIAATESHLGEFLKQHNDGPAVGVFQVEPATAADVILRYLDEREDLDDRFQDAFRLLDDRDLDWGDISLDRITEKLVTDLRFSCAVARVRLWMVPEPLPAAHNIPGLARYWKQHYNTAGGKGTAEKFIRDYREMVA